MSDLKLLPKQTASPLAALVLAIGTISCCLPFSFLGALGLVGFATSIQQYSKWFIGGSMLLIALGFYQLYGKKQRQCRTKQATAVFWVVAVLVAIILLFPQVIATIIAELSS